MTILLCTIYLLVIATKIATAQDFIRIDAPKVNDIITSRHFVNIVYSVIGFNTVIPPLPKYYPSSLAVDLVWKEHANITSVLSLQIAAGLLTAPYPDGTRNIDRKEVWKAPNCHFFSRYPPILYDFSLVFTPMYNLAPEVLNISGNAQNPVAVPVSIVVDNSTFPKC